MKKHSLLHRTLIAAISGIGLALGLTFPADSLTVDEAEKVTVLLVELTPDFGPFIYDDEEADRWFDEDVAVDGRIAAAGFSRESWKEALDETFRGYLATIPTDVFSGRLTAVLERLGAESNLSEEQKTEIRALVEEKIAEIQLLRAEGAAYLTTVRPHAADLEAVIGSDDFGQ